MRRAAPRPLGTIPCLLLTQRLPCQPHPDPPVKVGDVRRHNRAKKRLRVDGPAPEPFDPSLTEKPVVLGHCFLGKDLTPGIVLTHLGAM